MNKIIITLFAVTLPSMVFAQLKVTSTGKVSINDAPANGTLSILHNDNSYNALYIKGIGKTCINIFSYSEESSSTEACGIKSVSNVNTTNYNTGLHGAAFNSSSGISYGVKGYASNSGTGASFGVFGIKSSSNYGAGVYGTSSNSPQYANGTNVDGYYAGYFAGNMKVTGTIDGTLVSSSDARLKEDVQPLSENASNRGAEVLDVLESLTPVSFRYKKMEEETKLAIDEEGEDLETDELPNPVMEKEHFGLIAQELQEVYPNLVYEKDNGYLAVNYVELIPVLMQAIKELNAKVESLEADRSNLCSLLQEGGVRSGSYETATLGDDSLPFREGLEAGSSMDQNVPNPFTEKTDIAIYLPESVREATLYIYDLSGKQLEQQPVEGRGETVMTIHADKMDAGMYVYSLIADKKVVTTRKMIVVK